MSFRREVSGLERCPGKKFVGVSFADVGGSYANIYSISDLGLQPNEEFGR